ncbi:preprotein translocase subunit SecG [Mucilaginibacter sp. HC2]|uniref:preprotein translocase subunit SecG n=1 Tax=Mucilaginibacter inviolabilis TaxID=2714892 RepID=UPI0014083D69|nr:preprotein translocase subunit SecG [Mucilaginibacter inviolabilis]NHA06053.1 preprotein translocase subunit SecG [Mucilaginibacter inviolabilis]
MYLVLIIITIIVCILLGLIVLIQNPKGGGLSSNFSSSSQLMGVQKTGDFLEKGTWVLAISVMVLSLAINVAVKGGSSTNGSNPALKEQIEKASKPTAPASAPLSLPSTPAPAKPETKPAK